VRIEYFNLVLNQAYNQQICIAIHELQMELQLRFSVANRVAINFSIANGCNRDFLVASRVAAEIVYSCKGCN
jgi:hypothetical protein